MSQEKDAIVDTSRFETNRSTHAISTRDVYIFSNASNDIFSPLHWQSKNLITGQAQGRGTTWFFRHNDAQYVLRHYYRGGLIGKWIKDHYLYLGYAKTRAYREFDLLSRLYELSLPVPTPVACRVQKSRGIYCTNDIIISRIENADSVLNLLTKSCITKALWEKIGLTIREFHDYNVYHHDLNIHNILLDSNNKVWLIDFDQGAIRGPIRDSDQHSQRWKSQNIERLLRSFNKEASRQPRFMWCQDDWLALMSGYNKEI